MTAAPSLIWDRADPFVESRVVGAADIDGLDHTNNAVYVNWCGEIAWSHSQALGLGLKQYQELDRAMAVREAHYDYIRATRLNDELIIGTWIESWERRMVMERRFQILCAATGETVLRAGMTFVCIEVSTGRPKRPPKAFIEGYGPAIRDFGKD